MGYKSTQAVLEGLFARELTVDRIDAKTGKKSVKRLTAQDMALLLTVAARQNDPNVFPNDSDPIWYASEENVCNFVHFKKSALYESRNFLVKLGLLRYSRNKRHRDYEHPSRFRNYYNVYQINLEKLKSLAGDGLRITEDEVRITEAKPRITELHKDDDYLRRVLNAIADSLGINASDILPQTIAEAIRGKHPDSVFGAIADPNGWFKRAKTPLGALVSVLRRLPLQANDPNYRRQNQPTINEILESVSDDIRCLTKDAIKNTGFEAVLFVQQLIPHLQRLLRTPEGRDFAVETIDQHKTATTEDSQAVAKQLLHALAQGCQG